MSTKYHYSKATGKVSVCNAKIKCRLGGEEDHYSNPEDAQKAFENSQTSQVASPNNKLSNKSTNQSSANLNAPVVTETLAAWEGKLPDFPDGRSFKEVWAEKFAKLVEFQNQNKPGARPLQISPVSLLQNPEDATPIRGRGTAIITADQVFEGIGVRASGEFVVAVSTRQGGGNRECWCDVEEGHENHCLEANNETLSNHPNYIYDEDDSFDSTYARFYFDNKITTAQVKQFSEDEIEANSLVFQYNVSEEVKIGNFTPWRALNSLDKIPLTKNHEYYRTSRQLTSDKDTWEKNISKIAATEKLLKKASNGQVPSSLTENKVDFRATRLASEIKHLSEFKKDQAVAEQMITEAESLPDGPLKKMLLEDEGEYTYTVKEKVGRRNVDVKKTGYKRSHLNDKKYWADYYVESRQKIVDAGLEPYRKNLESMKTHNSEYDTKAKSLQALRKEAWAEGWYGDSDTVPEIPENF